MSIYIKDMEMPKNEPLLVKINPDGSVSTTARNDYRKYEAVPVPPHGRLGDLDAMLMRINHEVMEAYMDGACYGVHPSQEYLYLLGEIIDDAPTIIPAEEAEA